MKTATEKDVYLIEKTGATRQVWGPYTEAHARRQAGVRHLLARGTSGLLTDGARVGEGVIRAAIQCGSIRVLA